MVGWQGLGRLSNASYSWDFWKILDPSFSWNGLYWMMWWSVASEAGSLLRQMAGAKNTLAAWDVICKYWIPVLDELVYIGCGQWIARLWHRQMAGANNTLAAAPTPPMSPMLEISSVYLGSQFWMIWFILVYWYIGGQWIVLVRPAQADGRS